MTTLRYAPTEVFQTTGKGFVKLPVIGYTVHPPKNHPKECCIRSDYWALELRTNLRSSWQGFERAPFINSELRMVIDIHGRERDEVLFKLSIPREAK